MFKNYISLRVLSSFNKRGENMEESSMYPISKNRQKRDRLHNLAVAVVLCSAAATFLFGGCKDSSTQPSGPKKVQTQDDADKVAIIIIQQAIAPAPHYTSATWSNTTVNGSLAGSAVVTGSYQEVWSGTSTNITTEAYKTVRISYNGYCSDNSFPTMTGDAAINGTITVHSSYSSNSYSGAWYFTATVQLAGDRCSDQTWAYSDRVTCTVTFSTPYVYSGSVTCGSTSWNVSGS
jgi:predicted DNA-binding protein (MmcQ/YjbR family)